MFDLGKTTLAVDVLEAWSSEYPKLAVATTEGMCKLPCPVWLIMETQVLELGIRYWVVIW